MFNRSVVGGASLLFSLSILAGCGSSSSGGPSGPTVYTPPPASTVIVDSGPVAIRRELVIVPGVTPPPNPVLNNATPAAQNKLRITRYRVDADPPKPARAIIVLMPGFLGGAGSVDGIAKAVVRRSTAQNAYEAWAVDRRANLLEDTWGEDVAEGLQDPSQASAYYFQGQEVQGHTFGGFLAHRAATVSPGALRRRARAAQHVAEGRGASAARACPRVRCGDDGIEGRNWA